jgi:vancomycin permeability regulator SanA
MIRALRVIAAGIATVATILAVTVLASFFSILLGFRGNATFPVDCALVFGAAISGTDTAGPAIVRRVGGAAALWKEGKVETLILTGGKGDSWRMSEGAVMRKEAIRDGVDGRDILIEDSARSTKENLANSRFLVEEHCETVVAVSDRYHLARIRLLAKRAGWGSLPTYGVDEPPPREGMLKSPFRSHVRSVMRELAAYLYYALGADNFMTLDEYDDAVRPQTGSGTLDA